MMQWIRVIAAAIFLIAGLFSVITSVVGNYKFKFVFSRMQAATLGDTLGILMSLIGLIILCGFTAASLRLALVIVFLWISAPISGHLLVRMELNTDESIEKELEDTKT